MKTIEVKNIVKSFGRKCVVNNVSFSLSSGKMTVLCGRTGSGKTTTIKCIIKILKRDSGEILIDGKRGEIDKKSIGYIPEGGRMFFKQMVGSQLNFFARINGMGEKEVEPALNYWLEYFQIQEYKLEKPVTMSRRNQQKVQLISVLIHNPDIIILDEPFSWLDPVNMDLFIEVMRELKAKNKCILISSHQLNLLEELCEDICIIEHGKCIYKGFILDLIKSHSKDYLYIKTKDQITLSEYEEISPCSYRKILNDPSEFNSEMEKIKQMNLEIESIDRGKISLQEIFVSLVEDVEELSTRGKGTRDIMKDFLHDFSFYLQKLIRNIVFVVVILFFLYCYIY